MPIPHGHGQAEGRLFHPQQYFGLRVAEHIAHQVQDVCVRVHGPGREHSPELCRVVLLHHQHVFVQFHLEVGRMERDVPNPRMEHFFILFSHWRPGVGNIMSPTSTVPALVERTWRHVVVSVAPTEDPFDVLWHPNQAGSPRRGPRNGDGNTNQVGRNV